MVFILAFLNPVSLDVTHICGALMFASLTSEHTFGKIINWNKGEEILDTKAIMTVTCFIGESMESVSPSTHNTKGKTRTESELGLQGPAVCVHQHVRQPRSVLLVFFLSERL